MKHYLRTTFILLYIISTTAVFAQTKLSGNKTIGDKQSEANSIGLNEGDDPAEKSTQNDSILNVGDLKEVKTHPFYSKYIGYQLKTIVDTTLHNFEFYNPNKQKNSFYQDLGITGSANTSLILNFNPNTSFNIGIDAYDLFLRDISEIEIIETPSPFTQLFYVMGPKKENVLRVQHAQSYLDKQIKFGMDFKLYNTIGYYSTQESDVKNFNVNFGYKTKDKRYSIDAVYFHNKIVVQENGGIVSDSLYVDNLESNRQIISVNLATAENYIKYSGLGFTQQFYIANAEPDYSAIPDTNTIELDGYTVYHYKKPYFDPITPLGRISHSFVYSREIYQYSDTEGASDFYSDVPGFIEGATKTFDSISHRKIENTFLYSNANYKDNIEKPKFLTYSFGVGLISNRYSQDNYKWAVLASTLTEVNPQAKIQLFLTNRYSLSASGLYSYRSDNTSAYSLNGKLNLQIGKNFIDIGVLSTSTQAYWIYEHYFSDYFEWSNDFKNQKHQEISLEYTRKLTKLKANAGLIHDYLYFDTAIKPNQYNAALSYYKVSFDQGLRFGNFGLDINIIYQFVSDKNIIRVPNLYTNTKLFYNNTLFKGVLELEIGINGRYFSSFYANNYLPALRTFYAQDDEQFGNYPYFDVYLNAKIKRARIFFKYEQLNSGFMPQNYFISPHYSNPDAGLKFGVIWQLFN